MGVYSILCSCINSVCRPHVVVIKKAMSLQIAGSHLGAIEDPDHHDSDGSGWLSFLHAASVED